MQVIHTVKNADRIRNHRNIEPFKGIFCFQGNKNVTFLLRNSAFVTNVDTYSSIGMPGFGVWKNNTKYSDGHGDEIFFSWQNRDIPPNENKTFSYVVGVGKYKEYELKHFNAIQEYLIYSSLLKLEIPELIELTILAC